MSDKGNNERIEFITKLQNIKPLACSLPYLGSGKLLGGNAERNASGI